MIGGLAFLCIAMSPALAAALKNSVRLSPKSCSSVGIFTKRGAVDRVVGAHLAAAGVALKPQVERLDVREPADVADAVERVAC